MSLLDEHRPAWWPRAACLGRRDEIDFFPGRGHSTYAAKRVCAGCPVRVECLEYALETGIHHGIWGGLSERERRRIRRRRRAAAA